MAIKAGVAALLLIHIVQGYPFYSFNTRRSNRAYNRPPYVPVPVPYSIPHTYQDDNQPPESYSPYYSYYPYRTDRRASYMDENPEQMEQSDYDGGYYPPLPNAAATREAILQNLIIAQMYEDAAASAAVSGYPYYQEPYPEENDNSKDYKYGVPVTGEEEKERARQLLKNQEDEEVLALENLRKTKEATKENKRRRKQKNKDNNKAAAVEVSKRQDMLQTTMRPILTDDALAELAAVASAPGHQTIVDMGQKEMFLPQPPRPDRHSFEELSRRLQSRSSNTEPSAYQTIKHLLAMDNDYTANDRDVVRIQKRFVSSEDQLATQLKRLKKSSM